MNKRIIKRLRKIIRKGLKLILKPLIIIKRIIEIQMIKKQYKRNLILLERIKKKNTIKVAYFVLHSSVWKYDELYRLMAKDSRFDPVIIVCPVINDGYKNMLKEMDKTFIEFNDKEFQVIRAYNKYENSYFNVKEEINPDIIFYTNPHHLTLEQYYITSYKDTLSCYSQYSFHITHLNKLQYNQLFHNLIWKAYYETEIHKELAIKYSQNRGRNVVVTGFPGIDSFINNKNFSKDVWKIKDKNIKRIIWAPHHSIHKSGDGSYSNFLKYHQDIFDIAEKFKNQIQIAFKPHPILMSKLNKQMDWGVKRTEEYYKKWDTYENGQLETGEYIDLFKTSDAMIFDSCSFMVEYLYCNKPSLFTVNNKQINDRFNQFGKMTFKQHYHAYNKNEIYDFINNVILEGTDPMREERKKFCNRYLIPPNNRTASENIISDLCRELEI